MQDRSAPGTRRREFVTTPAAAGLARAWAGTVLSDLGADADVVRDLALVVSELASNAVRHGPTGTFAVSLDDPPGWWEVTVASATVPDADVSRWAVADAGQPDGRGLGIVRSLVDDVAVDAAGRRVRCRVARDDRPG